ncbi:alpha/beta-hydrolase [Aspergillus campestris IBT 28561]|uniref:Alpha/beta-hydrolase n=1 Tax=Aspergillus campestris (strain IBT 28561) TaxID=1392248 RepID=A0A2I1D2M1_ASPC2|nr:alpha/beta-hydrolase [Aspergillus campestris IBT 28561]PKY04117.1 alpha/beta-hydrolase [Aspergillus campestris IBT 28561]
MWPLIAAFSLLSATIVQALPHTNSSHHPSTELKWRPCNLPFPKSLREQITVPIDCATLKVPLDYTKPKLGKTLGLQLVKVHATKEPRKGSVIFNPGGPSSSGVEEVVVKGPKYVETLGGQFDVIGFDPRGTGHTMPYICNTTAVQENKTEKKTRSTPASLPQENMWDILKSKAWHDGGLLATACHQTLKDTGHLYGTAFVARDMLRIVDALNEDGKLRFWGRSYSTALGQTFAAMFPDRVGRMLLDSVLLADDYYSGNWATSAAQTDASLDHFFTECIAAGPDLCPFANFTGPDTKPKDLSAALGKVYQELIDKPIVLPKNYPTTTLPWWQPGGISLLGQVKFSIFSALYQPSSFTTLMASISAALSREWDLWMKAGEAEPTSSSPEPAWNLQQHGFHGIACSDTKFRAKTPEDMYSLLQYQSSKGGFADGFMPQVWPCTQWKMDAAERYEGSWRNITTSFPIMLANSPFDPITPVASAFEVSAGFKDSRVVVHEGHGHGIMNHPSACTIQAIKEYFSDGKLPEHGTRCKPDKTGFEEGKVKPQWWEKLGV